LISSIPSFINNTTCCHLILISSDWEVWGIL
jgi:hypothetical protein